MNIKWTDKITNKELWRVTKQKPIEIQIKEESGIGLDTHITQRSRRSRENHIRLESSGI